MTLTSKYILHETCFVSGRPGNAGAHKYCLLSGEYNKKGSFLQAIESGFLCLHSGGRDYVHMDSMINSLDFL